MANLTTLAATTLSANATNAAFTTNNTFILWWMKTVHVENFPLATFILILVLIGIVLVLSLIIFCLCQCCKRQLLTKRRKRQNKTLYLDEIPGLGDNAELGTLGSLEYSLEYNMKKSELKVGILQAIDLLSRPGCGILDPYVKLHLEIMPTEDEDEKLLESQPTLSKTYKTTVKEQTNQPCWNQTYIFKLPYKKLKNTSVVMVVYDYDALGLDSTVGRLQVDLKDVDLANYIGKTLELTGWLVKGDEVDLGTGDLCIVLKQGVSDETLHVTVLEAKRLKLDERRFGGTLPDTFVTVKLHMGKKTIATKQTVVRHGTCTPYFGDVLVFNVKPAKLIVSSVTCKLKYKTRLGVKRVLGRVVIGPDADVAGRKQWNEMLADPRRAVAMWHPMFASTKQTIDD